MKLVRIVGVLLIVAGVLGVVFNSFSFTKETHELKLGPIELSVKEKQAVDIPVWASFGLGPWEAVRQLLVDHRDFAADVNVDKCYPGGFNRGGWLKRVRETEA